ncbi:TPA: type 1 fimbrial protein [Serratia fonticola]|nr:type 1 fimbrial protein [Serratia fonticola]
MRLFILNYILLLSLSLGLSTAWAIPDTQHLHSFGTTVTISGAADSPSNKFATIFANSGSRTQVICNNRGLTYDLAKIEYTPISIWTGNSYQSSSSFPRVFLFESGVQGLNLAPSIRGDIFNASPSLTGGGVFNPAPPQSTVAWTGKIINEDRISSGVRTFSLMYLYKGAERLENSTVIAQQPLYRYTCYDDKNVAQETATVILTTTPILINVTGCTPDSKAATVNMAGIPVGNIENATSSTLINTQQQTFSLKCDPNIYLSYSVVDLNDPTNKSNISTLTADSTAGGVGYAITSVAGTRLQFGPDGSAVGIPGQIKYYLGISGTATANNPMSLQLGFSYVRKPDEAIKTGSAKSLIGITYSYQ